MQKSKKAARKANRLREQEAKRRRRNLEKAAPALLAALKSIRKEEEYRRKLCSIGDLSSPPLPKSIIEKIADKAIAQAEKE